MQKKPAIDLAGIFPPITTPFTNNGALHVEKLRENIRKYIAYPIKGLVVQGSNGEFANLSDEERVECVAVVADELKKQKSSKLLIAGSGCQGTLHTISMTKAMAKAGAHAALVITPWFFKGVDDQALYDHFVAVADASPIPVILYNVPKFASVEISAGLSIRLSTHPNIVGLKDSGGNITTINKVCADTKHNNFQVLAGSAGFLYPALCVGAVGGVVALGDVAPQECCDLVSLYNQGKREEALELQNRLIAPNTAVTLTFGVEGLKWVLDNIGFYGGPCRGPLPKELAAGRRKALLDIMVKAKLMPNVAL